MTASVQSGTVAVLKSDEESKCFKFWYVYDIYTSSVSFLQAGTAVKAACFVAVLLYSTELYGLVWYSFRNKPQASTHPSPLAFLSITPDSEARIHSMF